MKRKNLLSCLIAAAVAFCVGLGGTACMVTGLRLSADWPELVLGCLVCASIAAGCFRKKRGGLLLAAVWVLLGLLLMGSDAFWEQLTAMCNTAMKYYNHAYGIPIPDWIKGAKAQTHLLPLLTVAAGVCTLTAWVILRKKPAISAVIVSLLPLLSCMVVTDTVPDTPWLTLLLAGVFLLLLTQPVRRRNEEDANRLTGILVAPLIAALLVLSMAVPRQGYETPKLANTMTELFARASQHLPYLIEDSNGKLILSFGDYIPEEVKLSDSGPRVYLNQAVMEVTSNHTDTLYLRGRDYDHYDGLSWTATESRQELYNTAPFLSSSAGQVKVKLFSRQGLYYLPVYPEGNHILTGGLFRNPDLETEYTFQYRSLRRDWKWNYLEINAVWSDTASVDSRYLELPEDTRKRAETIVETFSQESTDLEKVLAIGEYVRNCADYDLNTQYMPSGEQDFALWFLEDSETGYCVHFASAATVLLRAADIPARYVEGYTVSVEAGKPTVVMDKMAHAWVEYYLPNLGWVILDPTPSARQESEEVTTPSESTEAETTAPSSEATTAPQTTTENPGTQASIQPTTQSSTGETTLPDWFVGLLWGLVWLAALTAAVFGQWYLRRRLKLRRMRRGPKNAQALARYREVELMVKLCGTVVPTELTDLAEKARFSQHRLTPRELSRFDAFLEDAVDILQSRSWHYRLRCRLIYAAY